MTHSPSTKQPLLLWLTGAVLLGFLVLVFLFYSEFISRIDFLASWVIDFFGGYYLYLGLGAVILSLLLAVFPFGKLRLGADKPEFSRGSWIAMLYSTGMGGGLMLRAVQEPVFYFENPPREFLIEKKTFALEYTFFHWGLTPWAFYVLFALIISYTIYIQNGSALTSSALSGRWDKPWLGAFIDLFTILCTLFGVVASVGLGSRQLLEAISYWLGITFSAESALFPIFLISLIATLSAYFGVNRGIKVLSNINILGATILLIFAWLVGSTWESVQYLISGIGIYLWDFFPMSLNLGKAETSTSFLKDWTYFYWAFWLSWAPFTGLFIARISKGRTIRELVFGALIIPSLGTFAWFSVFGLNGINLIESGIVEAGSFSSIYSSLFDYFSHFPLPQVSNLLASFLVMTFLITSIDSAIFVLSIYTDHGKSEPNPRIRIFWGGSIFLFTAILILLGKAALLGTISNLLILFALPFSFVFVLLIVQFVYSILNKPKNAES